MAIRAAFLTAAVSFWSVLTPGAVPQGATEPHWPDLAEVCEPSLLDTSSSMDAAVSSAIVGTSSDEARSVPVADEVDLADLSVEQEWPDPRAPEFAVAQGVPVPVLESGAETGIGRPNFGPTVIGALPTLGSGPLPPGSGHYPIVANSQVGYFLDLFTRDRRELISTYLGRSGRFMSMIRETLKKHGLPEDLAFTAMIESGFNPMATSRAGARGLWQFMATTAQRYGLRVDQWVDERLDPEKSTVAAAAYLRDLYGLFGSWFLAQAAYNAGEAAVARAIRLAGSSDFWTLARTGFLHRETKEFVPQIVAAAQIGREPHRFGFEPVQPSSPAVDRVPVPPQTDLRWLSVSAGISVEALQALNPALVRGVTPPGGSFDLNVPAGASTQVLAALDQTRRAASSAAVRASSDGQGVHVVRPRDTVQSIAKRYGVSVGDVLRWNGLGKQDSIKPGDRLRVTTSPGGR